jgi:hypothetical protein
LFSRELLQSAIPELLAQTGTSGRQFAHLLNARIRRARERISGPGASRGGSRQARVSADGRRCHQAVQRARTGTALVREKARSHAQSGPRSAQHGALVLRASRNSVPEQGATK